MDEDDIGNVGKAEVASDCPPESVEVGARSAPSPDTRKRFSAPRYRGWNSVSVEITSTTVAATVAGLAQNWARSDQEDSIDNQAADAATQGMGKSNAVKSQVAPREQLINGASLGMKSLEQVGADPIMVSESHYGGSPRAPRTMTATCSTLIACECIDERTSTTMCEAEARDRNHLSETKKLAGMGTFKNKDSVKPMAVAEDLPVNGGLIRTVGRARKGPCMLTLSLPGDERGNEGAQCVGRVWKAEVNGGLMCPPRSKVLVC